MGLALALILIRLLVQLIPVEVPRLNVIGLDGRLLCFSFLISLLAGILFGLAPGRTGLEDQSQRISEGERARAPAQHPGSE